MGRTTEQIKNYIQLHTAEIENDEYVNIMREIAEWAKSQADIFEYRDELPMDDDDDVVYPII